MTNALTFSLFDKRKKHIPNLKHHGITLTLNHQNMRDIDFQDFITTRLEFSNPLFYRMLKMVFQSIIFYERCMSTQLPKKQMDSLYREK
jgi:hypothetical protein